MRICVLSFVHDVFMAVSLFCRHNLISLFSLAPRRATDSFVVSNICDFVIKRRTKLPEVIIPAPSAFHIERVRTKCVYTVIHLKAMHSDTVKV
jgi:hypothetical protein